MCLSSLFRSINLCIHVQNFQNKKKKRKKNFFCDTKMTAVCPTRAHSDLIDVHCVLVIQSTMKRRDKLCRVRSLRGKKFEIKMKEKKERKFVFFPFIESEKATSQWQQESFRMTRGRRIGDKQQQKILWELFHSSYFFRFIFGSCSQTNVVLSFKIFTIFCFAFLLAK